MKTKSLSGILLGPGSVILAVVLFVKVSSVDLKEKSGIGIPKADDYRLPGNLRPSRYDLAMRMVLDDNEDFPTFTAPSNVTITFDCVNGTDTIVLNNQYITILEMDVGITDVSTGDEIEILRHYYEPELHFYKIQTNPGLEEGKSYRIFIPFVAPILTNDTLGLYRGYYTDSISGETRNMATTFFQPFGARRMLPLFDEPDMKAVFEVTIARLEKYHTLSNMNLNSTNPDLQYPGWHWDHFNPTVTMSPYLLCVIVSDFAVEVADPTIFPEKPVSVWSTPAAIQEQGGVFAAQMGAILLNWYQNYTAIDYALPKMDSIAIPQFAAGAMENWGLNTYRDAYLIYKPTDPDSAKIGVAETLSHELSHQWFGNYATCQWWDMMWLNEGLATFFTQKALISLLPEFDTEMRFIFRHHQNALKFDSDPAKSHPVVIPTDGFDFFDGTSMEKGGCLTRMMEYIFTPPVLQQGLRSYLQRYAFQGAVQDGLFEVLEAAIYANGLSDALPDKPDTEPPQKVSLQEIMHTWTLQTGYPLIRVSRNGNVLTVTQENIITSQPGHTWWVPVKIVTQDNPDFSSHIATFWIPPTSTSVTYTLPDSAANGWVVVNHDAVGFYRVLYDETLFTLIENELRANPDAFTRFTRSQLLDDAINLGREGHFTLAKSIEITEYLSKEKDPGALKAALHNILPIIRKFGNSSLDSSLKNTLLSRLEAMLKTIGMDEHSEDSSDTKIFRNDLLNALCELNSPFCAEISTKLFRNLKGGHSKRIPVNIQDAMYCGIVHTGGKEAYDFMYNLYKKEMDKRQNRLLIKSLGCPSEEELIAKSLKMVEDRSLWNEFEENRHLLLKGLIKSVTGRHLYSQSILLSSQHPEDIILTQKISKILSDYSSSTDCIFKQ